MKKVALLTISLLLLITTVLGQSKRELRRENARLKSTINKMKLQQENLTEAYKQLQDDFKKIRSEKERLEVEMALTRSSLEDAERKRGDLMARNESLQAQLDANPQQKRPLPSLSSRSEDMCEQLSDKLAIDQSYSLQYEPFEENLWGVQLSAFSSLCEADAEATSITSWSTDVPIFIRAKQVNGKTLYAIIQGAWLTRADAKQFLEDQLYSPDAFLIRH